MKKIITLLTGIVYLSFVTAVTVNAQQWANNGSHIFNTNIGHVGIGTNVPANLLDVSRNMTEPTIRVCNNGGFGGATFQMTDVATAGDWKFKVVTGGHFKIRDQATGLDVIFIEKNAAANAIYIKQGGNVGIGTNNPTAKLHVNGGDARINSLTIGKGGGSISFNSALGVQALFSNTTGTYNTACGESALGNNTTGSNNTACGAVALNNNTTGSDNTACGNFALSNNLTGHFNTAIGTNALLFGNNNWNNTACGYAALSNNLGAGNTACGSKALFNNTTGPSNTACGVSALQDNTTGGANTACGESALLKNMTGDNNTACGSGALWGNITGIHNTAIGSGALQSNTTAYSNTACGAFALALNTTGYNNTACGDVTLNSNTTGNHNTACGRIALFNNTTGTNNTALGWSALNNIFTGSYNTALGDNSTTSGDFSNSVVIGDNAIVNAPSKVRIGDATITVIEGQVAWSFPSDGRFKMNVREEVKGMAFIRLLRPVVYNFDTRQYTEFLIKNLPDSLRDEYLNRKDFSASMAVRHSGFVAQEVADAAAASGYDFNGIHVPVNNDDNYSISYSQFVVPLVKAVQEQQEMIDELKIDNEELRNQNAAMMTRIELLEGK